MTSRAQRSFAGGEIAPSIYARTDLAKYQSAVRTLTNFIVRRHGGLENRAGTELVVSTKNATQQCRLVKFIFNDDQTYVLEFGPFYIRFNRDGAQLGSPYEVTTPYAEADLMELRLVQSADVITITHHNYPPAELIRLGDTNWTLSNIVFGPSIGSVSNLARVTGGTAGGPTYYAVTAIDAVTGEEGLPAFLNTAFVPSTGNKIELSWDPLTGAESYNVYRSTDGGVTYERISNAGGTPSTVSDTSWVDSSESASTTSANTPVQSAGQARNDIDLSLGKPFDAAVRVYGRINVEISGPSYAAVRGRVYGYYKRDAETRVSVGMIAEQYIAGTGVSTGLIPFSGTINVPDNGYSTLQIDLVVEVECVFQQSGGNTYTATIDFTSSPNNRIDHDIIGTGFVDDGSDGDPLQTPPRDRNLFGSASDWPLAVGIYQQRRLFANSLNDPEMVWASRTGAYKNFLVSRPLQDDDAVTWSQAGRQVNAVQHLIDLEKLLVFTNGSEMTVAGDESGILRPDAINPRKFSANGSGDLAPLEIVDSLVYLQARRNIVRDIVPLETADRFKTTDLTLYAAHLFNGHTIVDWDYALAPHSIIWLVRDDGVLLGLTYIREEDVWAWHKHTTDGVIERVCTVPEGRENAVYLVVKRNINGSDVRFIERMSSRFFTDPEDAVFVDCSLSYDGAPATVFTGLAHLNGENVSVVADGVVRHNPNDPSLPIKTVSGGSITLAVAASKVHVGLPYMSDLETLDIDTQAGASAKDRKSFNVQKVLLYVEESKKFYAGQNSTDLYPASESDYTTDVMEVTIDGSWNSHGRIFVRHKDPLPLTILAAIPQGYFG